MNYPLYINPLYLLHLAQSAVFRLGRDGARNACAGTLRLFHAYRRAFNDTAASSPTNRYHEEVSRRL